MTCGAINAEGPRGASEAFAELIGLAGLITAKIAAPLPRGNRLSASL